MACFKVIILKNRIKRAFYVKDVNSNEKEGTTNEISLSLDFLNVKDGGNVYVSVSKPWLFVLVCLKQYNSTETSNFIVFIFF